VTKTVIRERQGTNNLADRRWGGKKTEGETCPHPSPERSNSAKKRKRPTKCLKPSLSTGGGGRTKEGIIREKKRHRKIRSKTVFTRGRIEGAEIAREEVEEKEVFVVPTGVSRENHRRNAGRDQSNRRERVLVW